MASNLPNFAMTLEEVLKTQATGGAGSSGASGVEVITLMGNPSKPEHYVQLLRVQSNIKIQSHEHTGERVATVLTGNWKFGFGPKFDETGLKDLAPGSIYTEPDSVAHFGMTTDSPVVVMIAGFGPTNTVYENPEDA